MKDIDIKGFSKLAESLKLNQKAEVKSEEENKNIIDQIYTDLYPKNGIIDKVNLKNTSILIGRKGTGKSTIFQKSISDQQEHNKVLPIYIDVKTVFDKSTPSITIDKDVFLSKTEITKYLLYKNFLKEVVLEVKQKLEDYLKFNRFERFVGIKDEAIDSINNDLNTIEENINNVFKQIDVTLFTNIGSELELEKQNEANLGLKLGANPELNGGVKTGVKNKIKTEFSNVFLNYLDLKNILIDNFVKLRELLEIENIYLYLDDFSEIEEEAQVLFIDWFIAPLNNLSDGFMKFKIASYPDRLYLGKIDISKIDIINLDFFEAYNIYKSINKMEDLALDYTKRLLQNREKIFLKEEKFKDYFDIPENELYEVMFEISMNIPRKLGYILSFCYDSHLIHDNKITKAGLGNAAQRYFEEKTENLFDSNPYVTKPFGDKINIANQKMLLDKLIEKQLFNKKAIAKSRATIFQQTSKPTSHFVVKNDFSPLLTNLELNGFLSTYNKIKDKSNVSSTLFSLDYGLCRKYNLVYGRPKNSEFRKYYSDSRFNLNHIIREHFNSTQVLKCANGHEFSFELLAQFKMYDMNCPTCLKENGMAIKCEVTVSNKELVDKIKEIEKRSLLNITYDEFMILFALKQSSPVSLTCKRIADINDTSHQFVTKRIPKLIELGFIEVDEVKSLALNKQLYHITEKAMLNVIKVVEEHSNQSKAVD